MERRTRQRAAIQRAITEAARPITTEEVFRISRAFVPKLGLATVYRALKDLIASGAIRPVEIAGSPVRYELAEAQRRHHHHFLCGACQRVFELPGCVPGVDSLAPADFRVARHEITLYGTCRECAPASAPRQD